jgi:hypothetical protein
MSSPKIESLRAVNCSLRARLARLPGAQTNSGAIAPTEFTDLLTELRRGTDCWRGLPTASTPEAEMVSELSDYRRNVELLGKILPSLQGRLLVEKGRLQTARTHVAKVAAWAAVSKKTL